MYEFVAEMLRQAKCGEARVKRDDSEKKMYNYTGVVISNQDKDYGLMLEPGVEFDKTRTSAKEPETPARIRLNFKGATFDQVIDFFSRATGLPVVRETDVPDGTLDYLAPEEYTLDEALEILNIILHAKGVALRVNDDMLYLQKLTEMAREDIPVFVGELPVDIRPNEIITVVRPL